MTTRAYTDRSRIEQHQRCPRSRFLAYHEAGRGLQSISKPLPLVVGGSVHRGYQVLLEAALYHMDSAAHGPFSPLTEDTAVLTALADFARYANALELDTTEAAAMVPATGMTTGEQLAASLGMSPEEAGIDALMERAAKSRSEFDNFLRAEQAALVEAMVRAYARRRLRPLLEQFEVLEVERQGQWLLSYWQDPGSYVSVHCSKYCGKWSGSAFDEYHPFPHKCPGCGADTVADDKAHDLMFMSRPDALLRERESNELYILSYKTAASWDIRKARDAEHDMQGLSEGVEVERRLGEWFDLLKMGSGAVEIECQNGGPLSRGMLKYLLSLSSAPRIHAIRYEYILKGERRRDRDLSARLGIEARSQGSHLVRQYVAVSTPKTGKNAAEYATGDVCWSWDYTRIEDMRDSNLAWQNWKLRPAWESPGGIRAWIDRLDSATPVMSAYDSTVGEAPRELGWGCDAQAMGVTKQHPLDTVFIPPIIIYRNEDDLRDWIDSTEHQERQVAEHVAEVAACSDEGERRHLLNIYFPMNRRACEYPSTCQFARDGGICYGSADMRRDAIGSGKYKPRDINHPQELSK